MSWKVRKQDVEFFIGDLWKDRRDFTTATVNEFGKDCFSGAAAGFEAHVLEELAARLEPGAVPRLYRVDGSVVFMERVSGIRLFDLIRHLRAAESSQPLRARAARDALLTNAGRRLREVQLAFASMADNGALPDLTPYPLELKARSLIEFFIRVLDIRRVPKQWIEELDALQRDWGEHYARVPFRDATTKNIIARLEPLAIINEQHDDIESWQRDQVSALLEHETSFWSSLTLTDVDFSSAINLSSPEDDPISLYFHEWTYGSAPLAPESLILDRRLGLPDPRRAAVSLLIRYLRFGGRKLAYRLVNSQGYAVRFAYDNPLYYFDHAREHSTTLDPDFSDAVPGLLNIMESIAAAVRGASQADLQVTQLDHVRRFGKVTADYWQQSPLEGGGT